MISLFAQAHANNPIYRYQTADGKVVYSDQAPARMPEQYQPNKAKQVAIPITPAPSPEEVKKMRADIRAEYEKVTARMDARERELDQALQAAQQAKLKAEQLALERERQREALPGERVRSVFGHSRLSPHYFQRQAQLDQQLSQAQQQAQQQQQQVNRIR
jgi:tRNA(Ile)-lysidine synthase TilS/MesJ